MEILGKYFYRKNWQPKKVFRILGINEKNSSFQNKTIILMKKYYS